MYRYGMRLPVSRIICYQNVGLLRVEDDVTGKYWKILVYTRKLTESEVRDYELDYIGEANE